MIGTGLVGLVFREGDEVVLAEGTYQGTLGVFRRLKEDVNWADITERNGSIRSHPVAWLARPLSDVSLSRPAIGDTRSRTKRQTTPQSEAQSRMKGPVSSDIEAWADEGGAPAPLGVSAASISGTAILNHINSQETIHGKTD